MKLPQIYTHFEQGQVFTIQEVRCKLGTQGNTLRKRLSDLTKRGYIIPIRQGLYRLSHLGESKFEKHPHSPYEIASKIAPSCYIGYKTALAFHANDDIKNHEHFYVLSRTKFNVFKFDNRKYIWCQSSESYGIEQKITIYNNREFPLFTTNIEKTIVDCLKRPIYCPNFEEFIQLCNRLLVFPDIEKLFFYAEKINRQSIFNRLGYLLEAKKNDWNVNHSFLNLIENKMNKKQIEWPIFNKECSHNKWKIQFLKESSQTIAQ